MNHLRLRYLIVEPKSAFVDELETLLANESLFSEGGEVVTSLNSALQMLSSSDLDVCFVSECFGPNPLKDFFVDVGRILRCRGCAFVYVRQELGKDPAKSAVPHPGFSLVMARRADRQSLKPLLANLEVIVSEKEAQWRLAEIERSLEPLFGELDLIASERKRGISKEFSRVSSQYINLLTSTDPELIDKYFESLTSKSADSLPALSLGSQETPEALLNKNLPQMGKDGYHGVSARVWRKMLQAQLAKQSLNGSSGEHGMSDGTQAAATTERLKSIEPDNTIDNAITESNCVQSNPVQSDSVESGNPESESGNSE